MPCYPLGGRFAVMELSMNKKGRKPAKPPSRKSGALKAAKTRARNKEATDVQPVEAAQQSTAKELIKGATIHLAAQKLIELIGSAAAKARDFLGGA